ncbi:MAG: integron integrase [Herminiimonas sp.]|nr:integron integrase [Herminiimonas sp.]
MQVARPEPESYAMLLAGFTLLAAIALRRNKKGASSGSVRSGKGAKDRTTVLPQQLIAPLQQHLMRVAIVHKRDGLRGAGHAPLNRTRISFVPFIVLINF